MYVGIDYGLGKTNINPETGIHYGIISAHSVASWLYDELEYDYGKCTCPECGSENVLENQEDEDWYCNSCHCGFDYDSGFPESPICSYINKDGYELQLNEDNTIWVFKSPYFTNCAFCSPCCPGAGDLNSPCADGVKTYCLGSEWFDGNNAPYVVRGL